jgi:formylglycine-generating enzyme required for sulfatase activity
MKPKLKSSLYLAFLALLAVVAPLAFSACVASPPAMETPAPIPTTPPTLTASVAPANAPSPAASPTAATEPATALPAAADAPMVEVPAGQFVMGIDPTTAARRYAEWWTYNTQQTAFPLHYSSAIPRLTVTLPAFAIDKLQVTNADYRRCVAAGVCSPPAGEQVDVPQGYFDAVTYADYPANVLWQQAATYCQWLGKRLPTEAEWEKAARGTDERRYPWGETWDESRVAMQIEPVGRHPTGASPYGVLDMIGDLSEWTQDTFQYYPGNIEKLEHPAAESRVVRGGVLAYNMHGVDADTSLRLAYADLTADAAGFRCAKGGAPAPLAEVLVSYEPVLITVTPRSQVDLTGMVEVPASEFIMGTPDDWVDPYKQNHQAEKPQHRAYLDTFYIDKYEVTNEQYAAFLSDLGRSTEACEGGNTCAGVRFEGIPYATDSMIMEYPGKPKSSYRAMADYERYPVYMVSWYGAKTYCAWLGKRLPTEAEWEKAARGTDGQRYPWGNEWDSRVLTSTNVGKLREIGLDPLNVSPYGVVDMLGNAGEWVSDWFDPAYYAVSPDRNPQGPAAPPAGALALKALRSPNGDAVKWGLSARDGELPSSWTLWGVRCAYSVKQ